MSALIAAGISVPISGAAKVSDADEEELDRTPVQRISMRQIEGTRIVDDQIILFCKRGCRPGMFHPISAIQAESLLAAPDSAPRAGTAILEPIEVNEEAIAAEEQDTPKDEP